MTLSGKKFVANAINKQTAKETLIDGLNNEERVVFTDIPTWKVQKLRFELCELQVHRACPVKDRSLDARKFFLFFGRTFFQLADRIVVKKGNLSLQLSLNSRLLIGEVLKADNR